MFSAVLLGLAGFLINMLELPLGWGLHFIFGNAIIYALIRVLQPQSLVLGIAISSLWTVFLWNHPWAWVVWVCEAIFVALLFQKTSPVRRNVIFWLVVGTPLLLLTYGAVMKMDQLSLFLVIVKQAANGILNIVLGELLYGTLLALNPQQRCAAWPKMKVESFVTTLLMAVILIPTAFYLALDAPGREQAARQETADILEYRLAMSNASLDNWIQTRTLVLRMYAKEEIAGSDPWQGAVLDDLSADFAKISITGQGRTIRWPIEPSSEPLSIFRLLPDHRALWGKQHARLVALPRHWGQPVQFALIIPFVVDGEPGIIAAQLRDGVLPKLINMEVRGPAFGVLLVSPAEGVSAFTPAAMPWLQAFKALPAAVRTEALRSPVFISDIGYGRAIMSDLRKAQMVKAAKVADLPEWLLVGVAPLAPVVNTSRQMQLKLFLALISFIMLVTIIALPISRRISLTLRKISQSAADLTASGAERLAMHGLVIREVNEILGTISSAGTTFGQERGALASYQRRLNSVAQHAPVIIYALDVVNGAKGAPVYVSESLEKILGYTPADAMEPGWWSHAVHPEDYQSCVQAFTGLEPGKVVNVEYRLRHKNAHYVWVYDTLSVESNPQSNALEAVGVIVDISERKSSAEQLLQADKMTSLGRMISGTAHELNQPLNFIKLAASNLRENTVRGRMEAERFVPKLENILAQVERASAILLQMRIFGRTPKESPYPIDVKNAVEGVVQMVKPQLELDGTRVTIVEKGGPVRVEALPMLLEQVLLNLLINANDAIRARFSASDTAEGRITISVERRGEVAAIMVADNGTGIPADVLQKIFDPFFTTKPAQEGTGLGLSISYGIIRDLGGVIRARSSRNGARFTIELPLAGA
ncbi:MAG: ATP-binding protein [Sphingorhabdus sp.]